MAYRHPETVRFHHVDAAKILYFSRVFELCHSAMEAMMNSTDRPFASFFADPQFLLPIVHAEADYKRPMMLGDNVVVEVEIGAVGGSSLTWHFRIVNDAGKVHATVKHVHACVHADTFKSRPIPTEFLGLMRSATGMTS